MSARPLKLAFVAGVFPGWSTTFVLDQIAAALDAGHEVDIFAAVPGPLTVNHSDVARLGIRKRTRYFRFHHQATKAPLRLIRLWGRLLTHPESVLRVLAKTKRLKQLEDVAVFLPRRRYDVIHCHFATSALRILPALQSGVLSGRLLVTFHGFDVIRSPVPDYTALFAYDAQYTANTEYLKERASLLGAPAARIRVFPMGVNPELFCPKPRQADAAAGRAAGQPFRVISVARLVEFKGIEFGVRAFAHLAQLQANARYDIYGDGPLLTPLQALARELGVGSSVHFHGAKPRDTLIHAMQNADVFVLPGVVDNTGQCEAQGVVLLEAAACGLPVVASRVGGIPEVVEDGVTGFLTEPKAVQEIASRLELFLDQPQLAQALGQAGRARVLHSFDQRLLNCRLIEMYRELAEASVIAE